MISATLAFAARTDQLNPAVGGLMKVDTHSLKLKRSPDSQRRARLAASSLSEEFTNVTTRPVAAEARKQLDIDIDSPRGGLCVLSVTHHLSIDQLKSFMIQLIRKHGYR